MTVTMKARKEKIREKKKIFILRTRVIYILSYASGVGMIISAMFQSSGKEKL